MAQELHILQEQLQLLQEGKLPKYLYHGTDLKNLDNIMKHGLVPSRSQKKHIPKPNSIFLSDEKDVAHNYLGYFDEGLVLRIESRFLNKNKLGPDDYELVDFIRDMQGEDEIYPNLQGVTWKDVDWEDSLDFVHQIQYYAKIPPKAISVLWRHGDPTNVIFS